MIEEEDEAHRLLDRAEAVGDSYGVAVSAHILRAREPATAIVEQADSSGAEIVVVGGARKRHPGRQRGDLRDRDPGRAEEGTLPRKGEHGGGRRERSGRGWHG